MCMLPRGLTHTHRQWADRGRPQDKAWGYLLVKAVCCLHGDALKHLYLNGIKYKLRLRSEQMMKEKEEKEEDRVGVKRWRFLFELFDS